MVDPWRPKGAQVSPKLDFGDVLGSLRRAAGLEQHHPESLEVEITDWHGSATGGGWRLNVFLSDPMGRTAGGERRTRRVTHA